MCAGALKDPWRHNEVQLCDARHTYILQHRRTWVCGLKPKLVRAGSRVATAIIPPQIPTILTIADVRRSWLEHRAK